MKIKSFLTLKYLKGRNQYFLSPSNFLSLCGIVIAVFSLIIVSSVMNGFAEDMTRRVIETKGEIRFQHTDKNPISNYIEVQKELSQVKGIASISPVVNCELLLKRGQFNAYSQSMGINLTEHAKVSSLLQRIKLGSVDKFQFDEKGIILGADLSYQLFATIGDSVEVIAPEGATMTVFGYFPKIEKLKVIGVFSSGLPEYDRNLSYISLPLAMELKNQDGIDYFETLSKRNQSLKISRQFNQNHPLKTKYHLQAEHWSETDHSLFTAIKIEKTAMFFVISLMLILSGFNIMNNNIRTVSENKYDISMLKSMGLTSKEIYRVVSNMGLYLGIAGVIIGEVFAFIIVFTQSKWSWIQIPISGFPFTSLPMSLRWQDFLFFGFLSIIVSYLSALLPAKKAMNYNIIQMIRENE